MEYCTVMVSVSIWPLSLSIILSAGASTADIRHGTLANNYARPGGQNVGNFLTDKPSSRVLAPPGGGSQVRYI